MAAFAGREVEDAAARSDQRYKSSDPNGGRCAALRHFTVYRGMAGVDLDSPAGPVYNLQPGGCLDDPVHVAV